MPPPKASKPAQSSSKPGKAGKPPEKNVNRPKDVSNSSGQKAKSAASAPKHSKAVTVQKNKAKPTSPKKSVSAQQQRAVIQIQRIVRGFLAKRFLQRAREERRQYEEKMEILEREAWLSIVQREREEAEKQRQREETERKKQAAEKRRKQQVLDAAFDGDMMIIKETLNEAIVMLRSDKPNISGVQLDFAIEKCRRKLLNCEDANGNTPMSEAAAGGSPEVIRFLIEHGACVNAQGAYKRTPLYRAAFGGHLEAVECLLENGGDPRICDADGNTPELISAVSSITEIIKAWDLSETDRLIDVMERKDADWAVQSNTLVQKEVERIEKEISDAVEEHKTLQLQLRKAYEELNKRIFEHDKCAAQGGSKSDVTLKMVHDAEETLSKYQTKENKAREKLAMLRLKLREEKGVESSATDLVVKLGTRCHIRELDDVLIRDVGDKIKGDGRYRDTNYIQALNPKEMEPEVLRMALLGAIRFGKPFVIDMMEVDMLEVVEERLGCIYPKLYSDLISKDILQKERYLQLVRTTDGKDYSKEQFLDDRLEKFRFVLVTKIWNPPEDWLQKFYPIRIVTTSK